MATMCFEKAGDAYREKWARAAGLVATADRAKDTNLEKGNASLQTASEIYESIGMHEKAATCYIKLRDFKRAGLHTVHTSGFINSTTIYKRLVPKELPYCKHLQIFKHL